jgi:hypothetical protein
MSFNFSLSPEDLKKIDDWLHEVVYPPIVEEQKKNPNIAFLLFKDSKGREYPYEGAIGGGLTYHFTPTGLGTVVKVSYRDQELDLTDSENW